MNIENKADIHNLQDSLKAIAKRATGGGVAMRGHATYEAAEALSKFLIETDHLKAKVLVLESLTVCADHCLCTTCIRVKKAVDAFNFTKS